MSIQYAIRHITTFVYEKPVSESVMELRMRPATDDAQRCLQFEVTVQPRARVFAYQDPRGNWIHHFNVPQPHDQLSITSTAQVEVGDPPERPTAIDRDAWTAVDGYEASGTQWIFRQESAFTPYTDRLVSFAQTIGERTDVDPLTFVRTVMAAIHRQFEYVPKSTRVDSPIDEALERRRGVCQDFTHIMLAVLRRAGLPARYVSGYIAPKATPDTASIATHAWVEVLLPEIGWVGVDPTNNVEAGLRHVRVAVGRDYADVAPTRGIFKGNAASTLTVRVEVVPGKSLPTIDLSAMEASWNIEAPAAASAMDDAKHHQQ